MLPAFELAAPQSPEDRAYLGLTDTDAFSVSDIRAKVVIIEVFSMYCPYCQREAPAVNSLYEKIQADAALRKKIKIIGIGAGNSPFEVGIFKKKYDVPFPLFPDNRFTIHKCLGEVRTPYFFAVKLTGDRSHVIVYSKLGGLKDPDDFLKSLIELTDLSKGD
ncbi:MAG: TlpA family protein disulfide reductase [Deltaproteobacteria bacterium]|nr:TlpA family protein disulfide reductase [Deltaproteobacteria bacterium]